MKSPDLNLLPIAFALYDELSVSRAARLLGMSQPAVSMALKRMRLAFDDPLFIRVPSGVTPLGTRMKSGSSNAMRIRLSAMLTAGWLIPSRRAARLTLSSS